MNSPAPIVRGKSYTTRTLDLQENTVYELEIVKGDHSYLIGRAYDDFRALYLTLKKEFKSTQGKFPPFPRKTVFKAQRATIEKRTTFFVDFFKFILERPVLTKHPATQEFIKPRKQILTIGIESGRNLASRNRNGLSDPFCKVTMYDTKNKIIGKPTKTPTVRNNLNPIWANQKFTFEVNENENCGGVTISCWSHDKIGRNPFLGRVVIPLGSIPVNTEVNRWFPLHPTKKYQAHNVHGEIKLQLHLKTMGVKKIEEPKSPEEDREQKKETKRLMGTLRNEQRNERTRLKMVKEKDRYAGEIRLVYRYTPPLGQWEGYLTVQVVEGKNIAPPGGAKTADPYVVLGLGAVRERTKTLKKTLAPVWKKEVYYFYVPPHYVNLAFEIDLYDWNRFGSSDFIGDCSIELEDMQHDELVDSWHIMCSTPLTEDDVDKKLGKRMAEEGYTPNLPVVIVPGFGSSSLEITKSPLSSWVGDRVWLSLSKIAMQRVQRSAGVSSENKWVQHLSLNPEDGKSDPSDKISVRPILGMDSVTYLDPGVLTSSLSYVMGPLVKNLASLGYSDSNMICAPYDWRVPPQHLEERDGYFTWLKQQITDCRIRENKKVVLFGHSMGNRTIQYFLNWAVNQEGGPQWISDNIHTFIACGAPWLGAPKTLRALCTGDLLSLDGLLVRKEAISFARTAGSTLQLLPMDPNLGREHPSFFTKQEGGQSKLAIVGLSQIMKMSGADKQVDWLQNYYASDMNFGGGHPMESLPDWPIFRPPPVSRVFVIYGVGLETERFQFYIENAKKKRIDLDENPPVNESDEKWKNFKIKKGIAYEVPETPQENIARFTGRPGNNSGDGTVPYSSLSYPNFWRRMAPSMDLRIEELQGVEHREILNNRLFFRKFIDYVAEKPEKITSPGDLTIRAKNYLAHYNMNNQAYVQDIDDESDDEGNEKEA